MNKNVLKKKKKTKERYRVSPKHQNSSKQTANPILKTKQKHLPQTSKLYQERGAYKLSGKHTTLQLED